jgi:hypothetical protein
MEKIVFTNAAGQLCVLMAPSEMFDATSRTRLDLASHGLLMREIEIQEEIVAEDGEKTLLSHKISLPVSNREEIIDFIANTGVDPIDVAEKLRIQNKAGVPWREKVLAIIALPKVAWRIVKEEDFPASQEFRNAWCDVMPESSIDISLAKAKEIALENLRAARDEELKKLDVPFMRALEAFVVSGDAEPAKEIMSAKEILRSATDELKSFPAVGFNDENVLCKIRELSILQPKTE